MITRRDFLCAAAGGVLGATALRSFAGQKTRSSAGKLGVIGLQLYTVTKQLDEDFEGTLEKIAAIGYKEVELTRYYGRTPQQLRAAFDHHGLKATGIHVSQKVLRDDLDKSIEAASVIGLRYLICPWLPPEERRNLDDYRRLADLLNHAGEKSLKADISVGFHNHDFDFTPLEGEVPYDLLLAETDPKLVRMEMDLYWITKAKRNPEDYFDKYPGRFDLFHVKDMDNTPQQFFTEVGRGVINFRNIFARSEQAGVKYYIVEQDKCPGSPFESIKTSFQYLRQLKF